jgi:hypothetical protein
MTLRAPLDPARKVWVKLSFGRVGATYGLQWPFPAWFSRRERAGSLTCSRAEHEFQVRLEAMSNFSSVIPLDLDAVDIGGVGNHNAGRFPPAQAHMSAKG